jgi:hypothetical protein
MFAGDVLYSETSECWEESKVPFAPATSVLSPAGPQPAVTGSASPANCRWTGGESKRELACRWPRERRPPLRTPVDKPPLTAEGTGPAKIPMTQAALFNVRRPTHTTYTNTHMAGRAVSHAAPRPWPATLQSTFQSISPSWRAGCEGGSPGLFRGTVAWSDRPMGKKPEPQRRPVPTYTHEISQGWRGTPRQPLATPKRLGGNNIQPTTSGRPQVRPGPVSERSTAQLIDRCSPSHSPRLLLPSRTPLLYWSNGPGTEPPR